MGISPWQRSSWLRRLTAPLLSAARLAWRQDTWAGTPCPPAGSRACPSSSPGALRKPKHKKKIILKNINSTITSCHKKHTQSDGHIYIHINVISFQDEMKSGSAPAPTNLPVKSAMLTAEAQELQDKQNHLHMKQRTAPRARTSISASLPAQSLLIPQRTPFNLRRASCAQKTHTKKMPGFGFSARFALSSVTGSWTLKCEIYFRCVRS